MYGLTSKLKVNNFILHTHSYSPAIGRVDLLVIIIASPSYHSKRFKSKLQISVSLNYSHLGN